MRPALLLLGLALGSAPVTRAQAGEPADEARRAELRRELRALAAAESRAVAEARQARGAARRAPAAGDTGDRLRRVEALLDTLVLQRAAGGGELAALERAYPGSTLLKRTRADLELRDGRPRVALAGYEQLLGDRPRDAALARRRARALLQVADTARALAAWSAVLDAAPEDREAFEALLRLRSATGTLPVLEAQLQRLRLLSGDSLLLRSREGEVAEWRERPGGRP